MTLKQFGQYVTIAAAGGTALSISLTFVGKYYGIDYIKSSLAFTRSEVGELRTDVTKIKQDVSEIKGEIKYGKKFSASINSVVTNWHSVP